jgi:hypothetical protein
VINSNITAVITAVMAYKACSSDHSSDQFQHRLDDLETPSRSGAFAVFKFSTAPSLRSLHAPFLAHTDVACTWITGEIALFHQDAVRFSGRHHVGHGMPRFDFPSLIGAKFTKTSSSKMRDKERHCLAPQAPPGTQHRAQARFMSRLKWGP